MGNWISSKSQYVNIRIFMSHLFVYRSDLYLMKGLNKKNIEIHLSFLN